MRLLGVVAVIQIIEVYSASKISVPNDDESLITLATGSIVDRCFGLLDRWSELLIINKHDSHRMVAKIYHDSITSTSILSPGRTKSDQLVDPEKYSNYSDAGVRWLASKPTAVIISTPGLKQLKSILNTLKSNTQRPWCPRSYFLIVLETECNVTESNEMLKVIWDYWILNAVILCSTNHASRRDQSEIELFTFNPYSADHSSQWEMIIHEVIEVSIYPGNFNHSWYVFKQGLGEIRFSKNCGDLYFDKTANLDGYVIPVGIMTPGLLSPTASGISHYYKVDRRVMRNIAKRLRFSVVEAVNDNPHGRGKSFRNGSYNGLVDDLRDERSHLIPTIRNMNFMSGVEYTYPHTLYTACFASRIAGFSPQWMNITFAKQIWIGIGFCIICLTFVLYLQNKSYGIVSAFLDTERLITGSSIIHLSQDIKHRMIMGSIFLVLLVVDGCIRGRFISILTLARPLPNLDTLKQVKDQGVKLYGHTGWRDGIVDLTLRARYNSNISFGQCIEALENGGRQRACFASCTTLPFQIMNSTILHQAPRPVWASYVAFTTAVHWPMTNRYSLEVQKLVMSGLHDKWHEDVAREFEVKAWKQKRAAVPPYVRPTKLNDLLVAFVLLFVGLSVASIVFAWEMKTCANFRCVKS